MFDQRLKILKQLANESPNNPYYKKALERWEQFIKQQENLEHENNITTEFRNLEGRRRVED